ncbi:hypothetical protein BC829DRAFT_414639 [Chytridium lagenaria]|nr:hypothetical protein BC829DRAFT_414639 [Chytridium lagenaria]
MSGAAGPGGFSRSSSSASLPGFGKIKDGMTAKSAKDDMATVVLDSPQPAAIYRFIAKIENILDQYVNDPNKPDLARPFDDLEHAFRVTWNPAINLKPPVDSVAHLVPRAQTTLEQLKKVLRRNFAPNTDVTDLATKVEQFQWDTSRMSPLEALNKLTYLNTSLPSSNRLQDEKLKDILIRGCQDDRWKSLVKKETFTSGRKWDHKDVSADDIVDHMQLHHPRLVKSLDTSSETAAIVQAFSEKIESLSQAVSDGQREVIRLRREIKKTPNTRDNLMVHIAENTDLPLPFPNMSDELVNPPALPSGVPSPQQRLWQPFSSR